MTRTLALICGLTVAGLMIYVPEAEAIQVTYSNISGTGFQYTQNGVRHRFYYNNFSTTGHYHSNSGDYIWGHASCCSNRARIDMSSGGTFTLDNITRRRSGNTTWTAYNASGSSIGSVSISGSSGVYNFPANWTNLSRVDIVWSSGQFGWDNMNINTCSSTTAQAGGPYSVAEGSAVTLSGSGTPSGVNYAWDFDSGSGGGPYNDGSSASQSLNTATLGWDGTSSHTIGLQVTCPSGSGASTDTATVNVSNVAPTVNASVPGTGTEGSPVSFSVTASDPGPDTLTYLWSFGDGNSSTQQNPTHTYADNGSYSVTVTVGDGETTTQGSGTIVISNAAPTVSIGGDSTGVEGTAMNFTSTVTDAGVNDTHTYLWSFGDGGSSTSANPSHTYADEGPGSYTVGLTVTDNNGDSSSTTAAITVSNVVPTVTTASGAGQPEGSPVSFTASSTDPGVNDTVTYAWNFGDTQTGSGAAPSHTYADDGTYTVSVVATDNDGGASTAFTFTVTITNVAPTVASISGPVTGDEGSALTFAATGSDPGTVDQANLTFGWDWGDSTSAGAGPGPSHTWADDTPGPTYTITVTTTDPQGATGTDTYTVTIANVAPTITTNPGLAAAEDALYTYQAQSADPGADPANWTLSPASLALGVTVDGNGLVSWTPTFAHVGPNAITITVDDGDGGTDTQTWTVIVGFTDDDGDGMADTWETDNGLDPTDPADAALDPDGDCLTNLQEFNLGQDPNVSDVPTAPTLTSPIGGEEVADSRPPLTWDPATDPNNDVLTYGVEVYDDGTMANLVTSVTGLITLDWQVDTPLTENGTYYWRANAHDGACDGPFTDLEAFFVNEVNEPPEMPVAVFPVDGERVGTLTPSPELIEGPDPDNDVVDHDIRVWNADGDTIVAEGTVAGTARNVSWTVTTTLEEDTWYAWDARAVDEHGLASDWIELEDFFTTSENAPPLDVRWVDPLDGDFLETLSPVLEATESVDPEGRSLEYEFELDLDAGFGSGDLVAGVVAHTGDGTVTWDLGDDGIELDENNWWNGRVRAVDQEDGVSAWDVIAFFVRGDNDPPAVPVLISPEDGSTHDTPTPVFAVAHSVDPEEDTVFYEILVATDVEGTAVVTTVEGLLGGAGPEGTADQTSWRSDTNLTGVVYWTARAVDERGAASDWAEPWMLTADTGEPVGAQPDDILTGGCGACSPEASMASADSPLGFVALAMLLLVPAVRRRR